MRRAGVPRRAGFLMVEVMIGLALLAIAFSTLSAVLIVHGRGVASRREQSVSQAAVRTLVDELERTPFRDVWATYNAGPDDDPGGVGSAPGQRFAVSGLSLRGAPDPSSVGSIEFPVVSGALGAELREDFVDSGWGMLRDLDADGAPTSRRRAACKGPGAWTRCAASSAWRPREPPPLCAGARRRG